MKLIRLTDTREDFDMTEALLQSSENLVSLMEAVNEVSEVSNTIELYDTIATTIEKCGGVTKSLEMMFGENFSSAASMEAEAEEQKASWLVRFARWISQLWGRFWTWLKGLFGVHSKEEDDDANTVKELEALPEDAEVVVVAEPEIVISTAKALEDACDVIEVEAVKEPKLLPAAPDPNVKIAEVASAVSESTKQKIEELEKKCEELKDRKDNTADVERRQTARVVGKKVAIEMAKAVTKARAKKNSALRKIEQKVAKKKMSEEIQKAAEAGKITPESAKVLKEEALYVTKNAIKLEDAGKLLKPDSVIRLSAGQDHLKGQIMEDCNNCASVEELRKQIIRALNQKGYNFSKKNKEIVAHAEKIASEKGWQLYEEGESKAASNRDGRNWKQVYEACMNELNRIFTKQCVMKAIEAAGNLKDRH